MNNDDDYTPRNYQDELTTDEGSRDLATEDLTDNPPKDLGVDPDEFGAELNKYVDTGDDNVDNEARREEIEALDGLTSDDADLS